MVREGDAQYLRAVHLRFLSLHADFMNRLRRVEHKHQRLFSIDGRDPASAARASAGVEDHSNRVVWRFGGYEDGGQSGDVFGVRLGYPRRGRKIGEDVFAEHRAFPPPSWPGAYSDIGIVSRSTLSACGMAAWCAPERYQVDGTGDILTIANV